MLTNANVRCVPQEKTTPSKTGTTSNSRFWNRLLPLKASTKQRVEADVEVAEEEGKHCDELGRREREGQESFDRSDNRNAEEKEPFQDTESPSSGDSSQGNCSSTDAECNEDDLYGCPGASLSTRAPPSADSSSDDLPVAVSAVVARLVRTAFDDEQGNDDEGNEYDYENNDYSDAVLTTAQMVTHSAAYHRLNSGKDSPTRRIPPPFSGGFRRNDEDGSEGDDDVFVFEAPTNSNSGNGINSGDRGVGVGGVGRVSDCESFDTPSTPHDIHLSEGPDVPAPAPAPAPAPTPATPPLPYSVLAPRPGPGPEVKTPMSRAGGGPGHTPGIQNHTPMGGKGPWVKGPGGMMSGRGCGRGDNVSSLTRKPPGNIWDNGLNNQWGPKNKKLEKSYSKEEQEYTQLMNPGKWKRRNSHVLEWVKVADGEFVVKEKDKTKESKGGVLKGSGSGRKTNDLEWIRLPDGSFEVREKPSEVSSKKEESSSNSDEIIDGLTLRNFIGKAAGGGTGGGTGGGAGSGGKVAGGGGGKMSGNNDNNSSTQI